MKKLWLYLSVCIIIVAVLASCCVEQEGKKRGLFSGLGPVLALELASLLTINLIIF